MASFNFIVEQYSKAGKLGIPIFRMELFMSPPNPITGVLRIDLFTTDATFILGIAFYILRNGDDPQVSLQILVTY